MSHIILCIVSPAVGSCITMKCAPTVAAQPHLGHTAVVACSCITLNCAPTVVAPPHLGHTTHYTGCRIMYNIELCPKCGGTTTVGAYYTGCRYITHSLIHPTSHQLCSHSSRVSITSHIIIYIYASLYHSLMSITSYMYVYVS